MTQVDFNYQLANSASYRFNIVKIGFNAYDKAAYYHKENFPDVEITRPAVETDLSLLHTKSLLTVNGYIHDTQYIGNKLYIPNATLSMLKSRSNSIGILSFNKLQSHLTKYIITSSMLSTEEHTSMFEKTIITFSTDIQFPILVVAGYMIFENPETFYRVSNRSFVLRLDRLNYIEKLYELNRQRDIFDELNIPISPNNTSVIDGNVARSNETITKLLTLYNSFLVQVPVTNINTRRIYLEHSNVPGNFRTEVDPVHPIIVGYGKIAEYLKRRNNDSKYTVYITDAHYNRHLFSNLPQEHINTYNDHRVIGNSYNLTPAYFLNIYTQV